MNQLTLHKTTVGDSLRQDQISLELSEIRPDESGTNEK